LVSQLYYYPKKVKEKYFTPYVKRQARAVWIGFMDMVGESKGRHETLRSSGMVEMVLRFIQMLAGS